MRHLTIHGLIFSLYALDWGSNSEDAENAVGHELVAMGPDQVARLHRRDLRAQKRGAFNVELCKLADRAFRRSTKGWAESPQTVPVILIQAVEWPPTTQG